MLVSLSTSCLGGLTRLVRVISGVQFARLGSVIYGIQKRYAGQMQRSELTAISGVKGFDWDLAWEAVRKNAFVPPDRDPELRSVLVFSLE